MHGLQPIHRLLQAILCDIKSQLYIVQIQQIEGRAVHGRGNAVTDRMAQQTGKAGAAGNRMIHSKDPFYI